MIDMKRVKRVLIAGTWYLVDGQSFSIGGFIEGTGYRFKTGAVAMAGPVNAIQAVEYPVETNEPDDRFTFAEDIWETPANIWETMK